MRRLRHTKLPASSLEVLLLLAQVQTLKRMNLKPQWVSQVLLQERG